MLKKMKGLYHVVMRDHYYKKAKRLAKTKKYEIFSANIDKFLYHATRVSIA